MRNVRDKDIDDKKKIYDEYVSKFYIKGWYYSK